MTAPIVLVSFNRPDLTRSTLGRIREMAPAELFLVVDGPRPTHPGDAEAVAAVHAELEDIDWPCTVHRRYAKGNLGSAANIELGLDWVFEQVDRAIILEDDCLADPTFFRYCTELLAHYEDDTRIGYIGGSAPALPSAAFEGCSYAFTSFASIWGWATWRRAWQQHRALFPRTHTGGDSTSLRTSPIDWSDTTLVTDAGVRFFRNAGPVTDRRATTWAIHWVLSNLATRSLAITSATQLVENFGIGEHGTNTMTERDQPSARAMDFPLVHPPVVEVNQALEAELEKLARRELGLASRIARKIVPPGRLRVLARKINQRRSAAAVSQRRDRSRRPVR